MVTLALAYDIDAIAENGGLIPPTGRSACRTTARPTPRRSCSWCARATRRASRTGTTWSSRASRSSRPTRRPRAARAGTTWPPGATRCGSRAATRRRRSDFVARAVQERAGARLRRARLDHHLRRSAASATCCIAWENEAFLAVKELGTDKFEIVVPSRQHPGRAAGGGGRQGRRQARHARRWPRPTSSSSTPTEGQEIAAKHYYRPRDADGRREVRDAVPEGRRCSPSTRCSAAGRRRRRRTSTTAASSTRSTSRDRSSLGAGRSRDRASRHCARSAQRAARLRPDAGLHAALPQPDRAHPAGGAVRSRRRR